VGGEIHSRSGFGTTLEGGAKKVKQVKILFRRGGKEKSFYTCRYLEKGGGKRRKRYILRLFFSRWSRKMGTNPSNFEYFAGREKRDRLVLTGGRGGGKTEEPSAEKTGGSKPAFHTHCRRKKKKRKREEEGLIIHFPSSTTIIVQKGPERRPLLDLSALLGEKGLGARRVCASDHGEKGRKEDEKGTIESPSEVGKRSTTGKERKKKNGYSASKIRLRDEGGGPANSLSVERPS